MKYRAIEAGFLSATNKFIDEGQEFEFDGPAGKWMEPLEVADTTPARRKKSAADEQPQE